MRKLLEIDMSSIRVVDTLKFVGIHDLPLRVNDESGMSSNRGTPTSSADSERCFSTLKRIKTFSRTLMGRDRLNALAVSSIHKDEIKTIRSFNDLVIEHFAAKTLDVRSIRTYNK